jgi:hypothetical protein
MRTAPLTPAEKDQLSAVNEICCTCHFWSHEDRARQGVCIKGAGRQVNDLAGNGIRTAYPRTIATESCDEWHRRI